MWKRGVGALLWGMVLLRSFVAYADSQAATGGLLKEIMGEVASIRLESNMLKQQLRERHAESAALKKALQTLDVKLEKAAKALEESEHALSESKELIETLRSELEILRQRVNALNMRLRRLEITNNVLIGVAVVCDVAAIGAGIYAAVK